MLKPQPMPETRPIQNRKARFEYELQDTMEAGISLLGWEVKAIRAGRAQLVGGYVVVRNSEAWLLGLILSPLPQAQRWAADADRTRKLLLSKSQILRIANHCRNPGRSCIPTRIYMKGRYIKAEIALAVGRKTHDKRQHIKDREWERRKARMKRGEHSGY
ncbi:MAG: SsrA-binding protein SmpB [Gammaproteobacteria bacterium]